MTHPCEQLDEIFLGPDHYSLVVIPPRVWNGMKGLGGPQGEPVASIVANCAIYSGSLAKIARDIALLMQPEIGEVTEAGGESSAMPNKRNPSGSVVALAAAALWRLRRQAVL